MTGRRDRSRCERGVAGVVPLLVAPFLVVLAVLAACGGGAPAAASKPLTPQSCSADPTCLSRCSRDEDCMPQPTCNCSGCNAVSREGWSVMSKVAQPCQPCPELCAKTAVRCAAGTCAIASP